jgi:DivIVA domain-containing protein
VSALYPRLTGADIRTRRFTRRSWRRGLDPDEVYAFLARVADEVELLRRDVRVARDDADRVKAALRRWQTRHARDVDGCRWESRRWEGRR